METKILTIELQDCLWCYYYYEAGYQAWCSHPDNNHIGKLNIQEENFPYWCPLPRKEGSND